MASIQFGIARIWSPYSKAIILKTKNFSQLFGPFMEAVSNFKYFRKKDDRDR